MIQYNHPSRHQEQSRPFVLFGKVIKNGINRVKWIRSAASILALGILFFQCSPKVSMPGHSGGRSEVRDQIIDDAIDAVGSRYRYGGTGKRGYDCSGLVYSIYTSHDYNLPRSTRDMIKYGRKVKKREALPGDLAFFRNAGRKVDHVAIVYKVDRDGVWLIHSTTSSGVITQNLDNSAYWSKRLIQFNSVF